MAPVSTYFDIWTLTVSIRLTFWIIALWLIKRDQARVKVNWYNVVTILEKQLKINACSWGQEAVRFWLYQLIIERHVILKILHPVFCLDYHVYSRESLIESPVFHLKRFAEHICKLFFSTWISQVNDCIKLLFLLCRKLGSHLKKRRL